MKKLYIFAGVNGAGKSTFYVNQLEQDFIDYGARINSDELVREFGNWQSPKDQNRAGRLALKLRKKYLQSGKTFNIETTLSGHSIVKFIKDANEANYEITLFYVGLKSVELSKQRVAIRVSKNGHSIDEATLERRFLGSFENLVKVLLLCQNIYFYDNSDTIDDEEKQKFSNLTFIAQKHDDKIIKHTDEKIEWFENIMKVYSKTKSNMTIVVK